MTFSVSRRELQDEVTRQLVADPAFRLLKGYTQGEINTIVKMVIEARGKAIEVLKAKQAESATHIKKLGEPTRPLNSGDDISQRWYPR